MPSPLVSTAQLAAELGAPDLVTIDGSWHMPETGRDAQAEYLADHIPGAVRFDIDAIADRATALPHMLPPPDQFAQAMQALGIGERMRVVVYDSLGLFSAARVWWTLRIFGMADVRVLDGGLPQWKAEGRPTQAGAVRRPPTQFVPRFAPGAVVDAQAVLAAARDGSAQIFDARARDRFFGRAPETRPGLRGGHIPGSLSLPWTDVVADGRLKDPAALHAAFDRAGLDPTKPTITSCGSGVTAAILSLACAVLQRESAVYDGSWTEWGGRPDLPVATD